MSIEIEAKMKVPEHAPVRGQLEKLGATKLGEFLEVNTFFDTEDRSLLAADRGLRIRHKRDANGTSEEYIVTVKGPRLHGQLKSREETEVTISSGKQMTAV